MGDEVLMTLSDSIRTVFTGGHIYCRVGGDEFVGICDKDAKHYPLSNLDNISYGVYIKNEYENKLFENIEWNEEETEKHKELREEWLNREEEIWNYREKMKKEAFDLFSKHFWNLWD